MNCEDEVIRLEIPTIKHKDDAVAFMREMATACENINGTGGLNEADSYEQWLENWNYKNTKEYEGYESKSLVPAVTFFAVRKSDDKIVGIIDVRKNLCRILDEKQGGNIGYSTRPDERRKGYAKRMMKLAMEYCKKELGLKLVRAGCNEANIGSRKTIESAGLRLIERREAIIPHLYFEWKE